MSNPGTPASAPAVQTTANYDGFIAIVISDMSTLVPDVATALNNLKLGLHDELICFVRRAG